MELIESIDPQWLPKHDALSQKYVDMMLDGIVNFEIAVTRIDTNDGQPRLAYADRPLEPISAGRQA